MAEKYYTDYKKGEYKSYDAYYRGWANIGLNSSSTDDKYGIYVGDVGIGKKAGTTTSWSSGRVRKTTVTVNGTSYTKSASNAIKWDYDDGTHNKTIGNVGKTVMIDKGTSPKTISLKVYSAYCEGHSSYAWYFTVSKTWSITIPSKSVTVTYNANGGSNAPPSVKQTCDKAFSLGGGCTRTNYNFLGWSTDANATKADYTSGESVQFTSNTTLYAVWELGFNSASITDIKAYRVNETPTSATPSVANDGTMGFVRFTVKNGVNETHDAPQVAFKVGGSSYVATVNTDGDYYYAYTEDGFIPSTSSADVAINLTSAYTSDSSVTKTVTQGTFISTETYIWDAYSQNGVTSFAIGGLADSEASKFDCYMDAEFKKTATFDADATFTNVSANALTVGAYTYAPQVLKNYDVTKSISSGADWISTGCTLTLDKGIWMVSGAIHFPNPSNGTGVSTRAIRVANNTTQDNGYIQIQRLASRNDYMASVSVSFPLVVEADSNEMEVQAYQSSGKTLSIAPRLYAVKIG